MLTLKDHEPIVNTEMGVIKIWNDETNEYEMHSFEFIQTLYGYIAPYMNEFSPCPCDAGVSETA